MTNWEIIILSLAIIGLSINSIFLARWILRVDKRVLDLEYPHLKDRSHD